MSAHSDTDEDVPPLEDFSDHFAQLELQKQQKEAAAAATVTTRQQVQTSSAAPVRPLATPAAPTPTAAREEAESGALPVAPACAAASARRSAPSATALPTQPESSGRVLKAATIEAGTQNGRLASSKPTSTTAKTAPASSASFCGFSRGFFSGGAAAKTTGTKTEGTAAKKNGSKSSTQPSISKGADDSIPFIRAAKSKGDPSSTSDLTLPEVQEALKASQPLLVNTKEWLTPDLQHALARSPIIGPRLADPKFSSLLEDFQKNPQETLRNNQSNPEMRAFLQEFCGIMGEHFTKLGEAQDGRTDSPGNGGQSALLRPTKITKTSSSPVASLASGGMTDGDRERMTEILSRPDIQHILKCQEIQEIFELARTNPAEGNRRMRTSAPWIQDHVKTLVDAGLLAFAP